MEVSIYRLKQRDVLALCVLGLLMLGVVMVQSAAMNVTGDIKWQWTQRGMWHAIYTLFAIVAFYFVGRIDYVKLVPAGAPVWRRPIMWMVLAAVVLCAAVLVPGVGIEKNGARRWLPLLFIQVQPSELAKWAVVLFLAWWLTDPRVNPRNFWRGFVPSLIPVGLLCLLVVIQDLGTAALIALCALTMLAASRIKWWHLAIFIPPVLGAAAFFVMHKEYRWRRMTAFLDPWATPQGEGYHMIQSLLSFSTGGLWGRGLGNGIQKLGYLPEDTTDFIFAVICEELGLFGAMLTITLYFGLLYVAYNTIRQKRDSFGQMLAFGVASMVGLQAAINIAVATVSVPTKGLSLPLVSAGGSGLVITCAALGLLRSITRFYHEAEPARDPAELEREPEMDAISTSSLFVQQIWNELGTKTQEPAKA
jgi:cell division protein FtsW